MHVEPWIRWYMVAFFALFGIWMLQKRSMCARAGALIAQRCDGTPWSTRLAAVVVRREELEDLRTTTIATTVGVTSLVLAVLAALAPIPVTMLYPVLCVVLALSVAIGYERLRRAGGPRVASLRARDPNAVVPPYVYALVAIGVVSPLTFLPVSPDAALIVTIAGLLVAGVARGVAASPAFVPGQDVAVEQYVDERLRAVRTVNLLSTAVAPAFVFASFTGNFDSPLHASAEAVAFAAFAVCLTLQIVWMRRSPNAGEIERWSHSGA